MPTALAIETQQLRKVFGNRAAVKGLTLQVQQGEVFGFLGPNGAGKTTSIKMLLGLISPTSGFASILGAPIGDRKTRSRVGFLPEHFRFQEWLTATEFLELHGQLLNMDDKEIKSRTTELLERLGLLDFIRSPLHTFSKGMLQRIGLAQALLNKPGLVILDEPTSGLDPGGRRLVRDIIHELGEQGTSVFLNSHLLSEIEVTCDRVAFIRHGELVKELQVSSTASNPTTVTIKSSKLSREVYQNLVQWGEIIQKNDHSVDIAIHNETEIPEINRFLVAKGVDVFSIITHHQSLEEIFLETIGMEGGL